MILIRRYWAPAAWMAAIFVFSTSQFGASQTGSILEAVVLFFYPGATGQFLQDLHFLVRKSAHFMEYALLAVLWQRALMQGGSRSFARAAFITLAICVPYAAGDEFHQSFVPERTASPVDVLIDSVGAAAGLGLLFAKKGRAGFGARC